MKTQISNEKIKETILKYRTGDYGFNCSETIVATFSELYNLDLKTKHFAGFGGGMGIESTCGAITASIGVLSTIFVKETAHENNSYIKKITRKFLADVEQKMGALDCKKIKEKHYQKDVGCNNVIIAVGLVLNDTINEFLEG